MKRSILSLVSILAILLLCSGSPRRHTIFIIGDSTAAEKSHPEKSPERGWGMVLQGFFSSDIIVDNHARNGRSSKDFLDDGLWQKVVDKIAPGDYVFIQFGHNDEKPNPKRHTDPGTTFDENLRRYVRETRERGGIPVLFSPVVRRNFYSKPDGNDDDEKLRNTVNDGEEKTNSDTLIDTHGAYRTCAERVARQENCVYIDANQVTHDIEQSLGVQGSRRLHMWYKPGELAAIPAGRKDNTHYNVYGARIVAGALVDVIAKKIPALKRSVRHYDYVVSREGRGNYFTLDEAIAAAPKGKKTVIYSLDPVPAGKKFPKGIKVVSGAEKEK